MSTRDREDDQIRWENRKEDANYARTQEERRSEIAKGFSHNTDALYALYGYHKEQPIYPAGYEAEVRDEVLRRRDRLLSELSEWPKLHLQRPFYPERDEISQRLSEIDVTDLAADIVLENVLRLVGRPKRFWILRTRHRSTPRGPCSHTRKG